MDNSKLKILLIVLLYYLSSLNAKIISKRSIVNFLRYKNVVTRLTLAGKCVENGINDVPILVSIFLNNF